MTKRKNTNKSESIDYEKKVMTIVENGQEKKIPLNNKQIAEILYGKKLLIRGKNKKQKELLTEISLKEITLTIGPAGTGKSFCSLAKALELLANPDNNYQKIYLITPNVEADGSELGFMPGDLAEKLQYYLFSSYYLIDKIIGKQNRKRLQELKIIDSLAVGFLRGCNVDNAILIAEESQNLTKSQMKTLLTRIGFNSKMIISGDLEQVDTKITNNGLKDSLNRFSDMNEIGKVIFDQKDIIRNPIISKILSKY